MARKANYKTKERNALKERQRITNSAIENRENQISLEDYKEQSRQEIEKKKVIEKPRFFHNRKNLLLKANNLIVLLSIIALIGNTIGRGFTGDWAYLAINLLFIPIFLFSASYVNPLDFSSDNKNYNHPRFNSVYMSTQKIMVQLFSRIGKGLEQNPKSSLNLAMIIIVISNILNTLFYASNFEVLAIPFIIIYSARVFVGNSFRTEVSRVNIYKWILLVLLIISSFTSVIWRTPFDYTLLVILTMLNTISIWFKNTYIYTISEIQ